MTASASSSGCASDSFFFAAHGPKKTTFASWPYFSLMSRQCARTGEGRGEMNLA